MALWLAGGWISVFACPRLTARCPGWPFWSRPRLFLLWQLPLLRGGSDTDLSDDSSDSDCSAASASDSEPAPSAKAHRPAQSVPPLEAFLQKAGGAPTYYPAGWGPWCLSWGWFGLGVALGALAAGIILFLGLPHQHGAASDAPFPLVGARPRSTSWPARQSELQALATQAGAPAEGLLCRLLREALATEPPPPQPAAHICPSIAPAAAPRLRRRPRALTTDNANGRVTPAEGVRQTGTSI